MSPQLKIALTIVSITWTHLLGLAWLSPWPFSSEFSQAITDCLITSLSSAEVSEFERLNVRYEFPKGKTMLPSKQQNCKHAKQAAQKKKMKKKKHAKIIKYQN